MHGLESRESFYLVFFNIRIRTTQLKFVQPNSYVLICIHIETYEFFGFCTNSYKIMQLFYELNSMNSYKFSFFVFSKSVARELQGQSPCCERVAQAASAQRELRGRSPSCERVERAASAQREPQGRSPSCKRAARAARAKPEHTSCPVQAAPGCPDH